MISRVIISVNKALSSTLNFSFFSYDLVDTTPTAKIRLYHLQHPSILDILEQVT